MYTLVSTTSHVKSMFLFAMLTSVEANMIVSTVVDQSSIDGELDDEEPNRAKTVRID